MSSLIYKLEGQQVDNFFLEDVATRWIEFKYIVCLDTSYCNHGERNTFLYLMRRSKYTANGTQYFPNITFSNNYYVKNSISDGENVDDLQIGTPFKSLHYLDEDINEWLERKRVIVVTLTFKNPDWRRNHMFRLGDFNCQSVRTLTLEGESEKYIPKKLRTNDVTMTSVEITADKQACVSDFINYFHELVHLTVKNSPSFTVETLKKISPEILEQLKLVQFQWGLEQHNCADEIIWGVINHARALVTVDITPANDETTKGRVAVSTVDMLLQFNPNLRELKINHLKLSEKLIRSIFTQGIHLTVVELGGQFEEQETISGVKLLFDLGTWIASRRLKIKKFTLLAKTVLAILYDFVEGRIVLKGPALNVVNSARTEYHSLTGKSVMDFFYALEASPMKLLSCVKNVFICNVTNMRCAFFCVLQANCPSVETVHLDCCIMDNNFDSMPIRSLACNKTPALTAIKFTMSNNVSGKLYPMQFNVSRDGWFVKLNTLKDWDLMKNVVGEPKSVLFQIHSDLLDRQPGRFENLIPGSNIYRKVDGVYM